MKRLFIRALEENNLELLSKIPKSDLHNHATRGGNIKYIVSNSSEVIENIPQKFKDLDEMQNWYNRDIKKYCVGKEGLIKRIKAAFMQVKEDGIVRLSMSFGLSDKVYFNDSISEYVYFIDELKKTIIPEVEFIPTLCFHRTQNIKPNEIVFEEVLELNFFKAIDLVGNEGTPLTNYKGIYKKAKEHGLILKAHVGEFGSAESIKEAVEILDLDEVQHGITAVNSKKVMDFLVEKKIQLNICPTSNVMLSRVSNYASHPISKLYHYGVRVTINTDDMLIFNQSVSDEYMNLYNYGVLSATELNDIRENSLE